MTAAAGLAILAPAACHPTDGTSAEQRCQQLADRTFPNTTVTSATVNSTHRFTVPKGQGGPGEDRPGTVYTGLPSYCAVALVQRNSPAKDEIHTEVWLPLTTWNGRFQGVGGGGFVSGISWRALVGALRGGYSTSSTDTGHTAIQGTTGAFVLGPDGRVDQAGMTDFASRAVHEMTVSGKDVTSAFYGKAAHHTYFNGCSQGGRQALTEAQTYPDDYDGIVAGAPAMDFAQLSAAQLWPQVAMKNAHDLIPMCKQQAFRSAVVAKCDALDGVTDGQVADVTGCRFDPRSLVGRSTPCGTITSTDAQVMAEIWRGPHTGRFTWWGPEPGSDTTLLGRVMPNGRGFPFYIAGAYFKFWLTRNPRFDPNTLTPATYEQLAVKGVDEYGMLASDQTDLSRFRNSGGKLVLWAGAADPVIPPQNLIQYYEKVDHRMGGAGSFARLFVAPAVGHCGGIGTTGPVPAGQLAAVQAWVERGVAPQKLTAVRAADRQSRPVCAYPQVARYSGHGGTNDAASFSCAQSFG